ncbi:MAG TPA: NAD-dependent epimerase/dehydratase family protein, partial [Candidatus Limnocylindrales bacterium]|nr:NAD-dependent epimerase/dehydratase family protein [Candidatus Limnocylindrales bacterium]
RRLVVQSYTGWNNPHVGGPVTSEADGFDPDPVREQRETLAAIVAMERLVLDAPLEGVVLRYANLYGRGAIDDIVAALRRRMLPIIGSGAGVWSWLHVEDAASATVAALEAGAPGAYNVADDDPAPVAEWLPALAAAAGAPRPMRIPTWLGRLLAGEAAVRWMTAGRGSSNAKAKEAFGWRPTWPTWREGFRAVAGSEAGLRTSRADARA